MLTKKELAELKEALIARKSELEEALKSLASQEITDGGTLDDGDQALSATMETLRNSLQDNEYEEYVRINDALQAIEDGGYGICIDCGEQISMKRLKYYPNAKRCLGCQEQAESQNL